MDVASGGPIAKAAGSASGPRHQKAALKTNARHATNRSAIGQKQRDERSTVDENSTTVDSRER